MTRRTFLDIEILKPEGPVHLPGEAPLSASAVVQLLRGPPGNEGEPGPPGEGIQSDPGDFTLIFENGLI